MSQAHTLKLVCCMVLGPTDIIRFSWVIPGTMVVHTVVQMRISAVHHRVRDDDEQPGQRDDRTSTSFMSRDRRTRQSPVGRGAAA